MSVSSLYDVLEVSPRASPEVIRAAYYALMKVHLPQGRDTAGRTAIELNKAYEVLGDADKRASYDHARLNLQGKIVGNYRILEPIAEGGFGVTYKAEHLLVKELVCIKHCSEVSPQHELVIIEETKAMWALRHFAIPAVRDLLKLDDGSYALVMSYIPGPTLAQVIEKYGALDPEHVAWIGERLFNVLWYMHDHGVVHGDIKPQNIIIDGDTHGLVLVDFGLSLVKPTKASQAKGYTDYFAPPEEVAGSVIVPESDYYSLGKTLLFALTGDLARLMRLQVPSSVPDAYCSFLRELIRHNVSDRPQFKPHDDNIFHQYLRVRHQAFGSPRSNMKPFPVV